MYRRLIFLLFLSILINSQIFATVFVVTSKANAGAGTLRDALTKAAANGSAIKDYINFNLPGTSEADRTITITSSLPDVSSNLVIDGTSQSGIVFKYTDAKIKISTPLNNDAIVVFNGSGLTSIEFYGLYVFDYSDIMLSRTDLKTRRGFNLVKCSDITIGAKNKGNRITGFNVNSINIEESDRVKIKNNAISIGDEKGDINNGSAGFAVGYGGPIDLIKCDHIELGGGAGEGNIIFTIVNFKFYQLTHSKVSIKSNNFLVYPNGLNTEWYFEYYDGTVFFSTIFSSDVHSSDEAFTKQAIINMDMSNNVTGCQIPIFIFNSINGTVNLTHNFFNIARDGITPIKYETQIPPPQYPFGIRNCSAQFNFGTNNISDKNYFDNAVTAVVASNAPNIFLRYNQYNCVLDGVYHNFTSSNSPGGGYQLPIVSIGKINTGGGQTKVTGKATPLSLVDIYSSENCQSKCSIHSYIKTVTADAAGNWQANVDNLDGILYASATLNNQTSEFKTFEINTQNIKITSLRCNSKGTISGINIPEGISHYWIDEQGNVVSNDLVLKVDRPGKYQLVLGSGCITSDLFEIEDKRVIIDDSQLAKANIQCGQNDGSIKKLYVYDPEDKIQNTIWTDGSNKVVGHTLDVDNLSAGKYLLTVNTTDGCTTTYGPVTLTNTTGPNINQTQAHIQSTNCGQSTGSITDVTATGSGTLHYSWKNEEDEEVGTSADLTGQPGGKYILKVTDNSQCGPVYSAAFVIPEVNGITLHESSAHKQNASCNQNNGFITGITATGADNYQWTNAADAVVGTTADLQNVPAGDYKLTASNSSGCSKTSEVYHIEEAQTTIYPAYTSAIDNSCAGQDNGAIVVTTDALVKSVRWVNSSGSTIGISATLNNLPAGTYQLYLTDQNGCESYYKNYVVTEISTLSITEGSGQITNDQCDLKTGSIKNVQISGGLPPYTYSWVNANGIEVATSSSLVGAAKGSYTLTVKDNGYCGFTASKNYTVQNDDSFVAPPVIKSLQLCTPGEAQLAVSNPASGNTYRLYNANIGGVAIDEEVSGIFKINAKTGSNFYITQVDGSCESDRVKAQISVGLSSSDIVNAFSPNGDGINDYWKITSIENYPDALVQVFSRYGQKVYESRGYGTPFNGKLNGKDLPNGVYYYIINLNKSCSLLSGNLTIIR